MGILKSNMLKENMTVMLEAEQFGSFLILFKLKKVSNLLVKVKSKLALTRNYCSFNPLKPFHSHFNL